MMEFGEDAGCRRLVACALLAFTAFGVHPALAQDKEALIQNALSAAPPAIAETATVMNM